MPKSDLSAMEVLVAITHAVAPDSAYIVDTINRGRKPAYRVALVLRRLRALETDGYLTCSAYPSGYYGYRWTITPDGREVLDEYAEVQRSAA